ncbi:MAG: excinuclease ABC subunit UvrC [SAR324 cluster bacterium]|mgnify:FL=1|nr:excinuclease ABC subunit UvrC [SAR324 cluster bacterium]MDP6245448.1 excinuclease ABC subunit UvrC [SAR324 cluster bacterium]MDP6462836.1 excinuclease ABC subunit UvrC [SAR324 cluster bacterium]MDP6639175.1 excinuclease ABC subunit UvrC [SAR324 cluster bacterium]MDP7139110.1 excinuclease ABC subunit UvrC [SAR324 cluster bacterium]
MSEEPEEKDSPLTSKLKHLPERPGVYLFKNTRGDVLYVGKAKSLRSRVRSYFHSSASHNIRIQVMVSLACDVSLIITDTEAEALILEEQLIKTHLPRYNVNLKDDKSYPYCKLTLSEMYPRLFLVREKHDPKAEYYGPFPSVKEARQVLRMVYRYFQLRTSKMDLKGQKTYRPCLNFQLKRCLGPCRGTVPVEDYDESVQQVRLFMRGRHHELLEQIKSRMKDASTKLEFEKAAMLRDQARALGRIFEKQTVLDAKGNDQDVFNLFRESNSAGIQVLFIRNGRLLGTDFFFYEECEQVTDDNLLGQVLNRIYMNDKAVMPREILLPFEYSDQQELEKVLNEKSERKVTVQRPQRGRKKELVQMAFNNAKMNLGEQRARTLRDDEVLRRVQGALHLKHLPLTVEAFDISHLSGNQTVASMVSWKRNHASRQDYRKYRIQSIEGPDDFASMKEVLTRRYKRTLSGEMPLPNLILIDGGKGQVNVAHQVLQDLGIPLERIDLIGLAKGRSERRRVGGGSRLKDFEYIVKPNMKNEIRPHRNSPELYFLQNIRDESHRFAIQFQRLLKRSENLHSVLEDIPGVGRERRRLLLRQFGSLTSLKKAQIEDLLRVPGISRKLAGEIHSFFSTNN